VLYSLLLKSTYLGQYANYHVKIGIKRIPDADLGMKM